MRVLIADDEAPARDKLRRWLAEHADVQLVAEAADGLAAMQAIHGHAPDAAFLDIQMSGLSGLEVAAQLGALNRPQIVFVTAFDEHALAAFERGAIDYLLKPYDKERLRITLARLRERGADAAAAQRAVHGARARLSRSARLLVPRAAPQAEGWQIIEASQILWLEADDNYVHVHTTTSRHMLRRTLADMLEQLGSERFARIHKSSAVNLAQVEGVSPLFKGDHELRLRGGVVLRLSRRFKDEFFARLGG